MQRSIKEFVAVLSTAIVLCAPLKPTYTYLGASLIAQMVKNLPTMQETPVQFLGQEVPLEKG